MRYIKYAFRQLLRLIILTGISGLVFISALVLYDKYFSPDAYMKHYQDMFDNIGRMSGQSYPQLLITDSPEINAYCTQENVIITRGMLNFIKNDDELSLVMGHEISHYILKHVFQENPENISPEQADDWDLEKEENADKLGAFLALEAGYDVCTGREIWKRLHDTEGDVLENNTGHPYFIFRYVNLHIPSCSSDL